MSEVVFTSGGSEANNFALKGAYFASSRSRRHFITTRVEHPAIIEPLRFLERLGSEVTYLPVDGAGLIDPDDLRRAITANTILISVMHANNEVGTIQPIEECAAIAREHGILFHTDAAQSVGKISNIWKNARFRIAAELKTLAYRAGLAEAKLTGAIFYPPIGLAARLMAPFDRSLGKLTTFGAAFLVLTAIKPAAQNGTSPILGGGND